MSHPQLNDHSGHTEHGHGDDHIPHILPLRVYFGTWILLLILTAVTVGASYVDLGNANLFIALLIATIKASTVAMLFMHLLYDHKFHAIIFSMSLIFLGVFIFFTMADTGTRGRTDAIEGDKPTNLKQPFNGTEEQAELKAHYQAIAAHRKAIQKIEPEKPGVNPTGH